MVKWLFLIIKVLYVGWGGVLISKAGFLITIMIYLIERTL